MENQNKIPTVEEIKKEREEWRAQWLKYCRTCQGTGLVESGGDWVDYGSARVLTPGLLDSCPICSDEGVCPRCGVLLFPDDYLAYNKWLEDTNPCPHCSWKWGEKEGDNLPYVGVVFIPEPEPTEENLKQIETDAQQELSWLHSKGIDWEEIEETTPLPDIAFGSKELYDQFKEEQNE